MRGSYCDQEGLSYLFDMNEVKKEDEPREEQIQKSYEGQFFPLCIDSLFYGNESRFINHSCDPNVHTYNIVGQKDAQVVNRIALFANRDIKEGEEISIDYKWDKFELSIKADVLCLCGSNH